VSLSLEADGSSLVPARREVSLGVDLSGRSGSLYVDAGRTDRDGSDTGTSVYGGGLLRLGAASLMASGRWWSLEQTASWSVAPSLALQASWWDARMGYRLYRTEANELAIDAHSVDGQVGISLTQVTRVTLRGERQWGSNLRGTRIQLGVWRSF
jgi:hypothetical protein